MLVCYALEDRSPRRRRPIRAAYRYRAGALLPQHITRTLRVGAEGNDIAPAGCDDRSLEHFVGDVSKASRPSPPCSQVPAFSFMSRSYSLQTGRFADRHRLATQNHALGNHSPNNSGEAAGFESPAASTPACGLASAAMRRSASAMSALPPPGAPSMPELPKILRQRGRNKPAPRFHCRGGRVRRPGKVDRTPCPATAMGSINSPRSKSANAFSYSPKCR